MNKMWMKIVSKNYSKHRSIKTFLFYNCLKHCLIGFIVWLIVSRRYFNTIEWAICFVGYPGMFIGFFGGIIYLCRK